jgi:drug/metabolite transporter (DMT)-like permease
VPCEKIMMNYLGEIAALGTALSWSFGSIFFTISSRRIGSNEVNRLRLTLALFLLLLAHVILYGRLIPAHVTNYHVFWFGLSGLIGFSLGDTLLFRAFVLIGPRLSMLLMSLVPIFGTIIAWLFLHEILNLTEILAIIIVLAGIIVVILSGRPPEQHTRSHYMTGIIYGIGGAFGQAIGLILSKKGLENNFSALSGNIIRIFFAMVVLWIFTLCQGKIALTFKKLKDTKGAITMCGGTLFGPMIGVSLSLVAVQYAYVGIASTLMALPPIFLIPLSWWIFREKTSLVAIGGTIIAVIGVALIFLV